jgi:hypothetical protein
MVLHAASFHDEDDDDDPPKTLDLHDVAKKGVLKQLSKLLKHAKEYKIEVDAVDEAGRTALMMACRAGQGKAVEYLMQAGASADMKDNEGYAAIHHSVFASVDKFIGISRAASGLRALAKYRAFMDRKTVDGYTAGNPPSLLCDVSAVCMRHTNIWHTFHNSACGCQGARHRHYIAAQVVWM